MRQYSGSQKAMHWLMVLSCEFGAIAHTGMIQVQLSQAMTRHASGLCLVLCLMAHAGTER